MNYKKFTPYWIVRITSHDEWSGPEVEDEVDFRLPSNEL